VGAYNGGTAGGELDGDGAADAFCCAAAVMGQTRSVVQTWSMCACYWQDVTSAILPAMSALGS
jgi:hypothetical protein